MCFIWCIMDFLIKFTEKPNFATKKVAIQFAKQCNYELIDGVYFVHFTEIDSKLIKLLNFTRGWSTAEFIVEQGKLDSSKVCNVLFCSMYETCTGVCEKVQLIPNYNLGFFVNRLWNYVNRGSFPNPRSYEGQIIDAKYVQKTDDPQIFQINKEIIIAEVKRQIKYPLIFCDKISERKCIEPIESLPIKIKIQNSFEQINFDDEKSDEIDNDGFSESDIKLIEAEANIRAPIYAKAIAKEFEELLKKYR